MATKKKAPTSPNSVTLYDSEWREIEEICGPLGGNPAAFCSTVVRSTLKLRPEMIRLLNRALLDDDSRRRIEDLLHELDRRQ